MSNSLVQWLLQPDSYADRPGSVTLAETHISWVFLTDRHAYKLKKPVRFDFLDFSTVELRHHWCTEEVRLNRRLAADVYLGVVAVRRTPQGELSLDEHPVDSANPASGEVVDWLVKMQRLPADRTVLELHRAKRIHDADLDRLALRLAQFYRNAAPLALDPQAFRDEIERHVRANRAELLAHHAQPDSASETHAQIVVKRVHSAQLQMLKLRSAVLDARLADGRVIDGHGDLRPEHIYLLPDPVVIDCIEFNPKYRQLDVADELSFLATECDFIDAPAIGRRVQELCHAALGDSPPPELLAFYRCYRACVRAKVALLRSRQLEDGPRRSEVQQVARHLELANRYADELAQELRPLTLVVHGLPGSGKSTLATALADELGAELLSTDAIRRKMFGPSSTPAEYNAGNYAPQSRAAVYDALIEQTNHHLEHGISVVLDGTFPLAATLNDAAQVAERHQSPFRLITCRCPEPVALERIAKRLTAGASDSEIRPEFYLQQRAATESPPESLDRLKVDTTAHLNNQLARVMAHLQSG